MMTDPNLYLKLGRLGSADKEKVLGCCIFASPFFPRHLSPPALSGGRGWGDCVAGRGSCVAGRGSRVAGRGGCVAGGGRRVAGRTSCGAVTCSDVVRLKWCGAVKSGFG